MPLVGAVVYYPNEVETFDVYWEPPKDDDEEEWK